MKLGPIEIVILLAIVAGLVFMVRRWLASRQWRGRGPVPRPFALV